MQLDRSLRGALLAAVSFLSLAATPRPHLTAAGVHVAHAAAEATDAPLSPRRLAAPDSSGRLAVARLFADHMVLQRGMRVPVWGWAAPRQHVVVVFDRRRQTTRADDGGRWHVLLPMLPPGGPHVMTITAGAQRIRVRDILVGDVWVASGQSNMELPVALASDAAREIAGARDLAIREFKVPKSSAHAPAERLAGGAWERADAAHVGRFSAVAYYFARALRRHVHVPVGIIDATWGGSRIEPWMSRATLRVDEPVSSAGMGALPTVVYNKMVHPLLPYRIRGVIWYQGESNAENYVDALHYRTLFRDLITSWRSAWHEGDFPFLWVQLPRFVADSIDPPDGSDWVVLREAQSAALALPRTGEAVTVDIGDAHDIHPKDKQDVGARLALLARQIVFGESGLEAQGPTFAAARIDGDRVRLAFAHVRGGLVAGVGHDALGGFVVAGADRQFVPASAAISGDTVVVWSDAVPQPVAVRYAWTDDPERANLHDARGLPAAPFRTDSW